MATGDQDDMLRRLRSALPRGWFSDSAPVLDAVLSGFAAVAAHVYAFLLYVKRQSRIKTASDGWLDLLAFDFFGLRFRRYPGESDHSFRHRVIDEILRPRATREGIIRAVRDLTGRDPEFFEPANPSDCGGYGMARAMGYNMAGRYGSLMLPYQAFVVAYRPAGLGVPMVAGYGTGAGGLTVGGHIEYVGQSMIAGPVTDADIYRTISETKAAGTVIWTSIQSAKLESFLDHDFYFDSSPLS